MCTCDDAFESLQYNQQDEGLPLSGMIVWRCLDGFIARGDSAGLHWVGRSTHARVACSVHASCCWLAGYDFATSTTKAGFPLNCTSSGCIGASGHDVASSCCSGVGCHVAAAAQAARSPGPGSWAVGLRGHKPQPAQPASRRAPPPLNLRNVAPVPCGASAGCRMQAGCLFGVHSSPSMDPGACWHNMPSPKAPRPCLPNCLTC